MLFKSAKGMYQLKRNYRDAFNLEAFIEKYIEECFDRYLYIVGDISSGILRLKGFDTDPKSPCYYGNIDKYLEESCVFGCPFYVLKRISNNQEYEKLEKENKKPDESGKITITPINKENFDKESLVLKSNPKHKTRIVIDTQKINSIPKGELPKDLKDFIASENQNNNSKNNNNNVVKPEPKEETTYVSASPDFDPSKKVNHKNNNKNNKNNNKNNNNHHKNNKNKNHKNKNANK